MKVIQIFLFPFILSLTLSKECKILALQGGGDRGSFQAGVLDYVFNNLPSDQTDYEVITGVSVGSIGAMTLAQYPKGQEKAASDLMLKVWRQIKQKDVFTNWREGPIISAFTKPSLFDTNPLREFIKKYATSKPMRKISIGTTDANSGSYKRFDDQSFTELSDFQEEVLCSSAMPGLFLYQNFNGSTYIDGGTQINLDIAGGVHRCLRDGYTEEEVVIDVILANEGKNISPVADDANIINLYRNLQDISSQISTFRDIQAAIMSYPNADFRYLFLPLSKMPFSLEPINFKPEEIEEMISIGFQDAKTVIDWGKGESFKRYLGEHLQDTYEII